MSIPERPAQLLLLQDSLLKLKDYEVVSDYECLLFVPQCLFIYLCTTLYIA